jgi:hypothetical protein
MIAQDLKGYAGKGYRVGMDSVFNPEDYVFEKEEQAVKALPKIYELIEQILDNYMSLDRDTKAILVAWIMAAPFYRSFIAFPYLFINASKGSGKTRLMSLICALVPNAAVLLKPSESALFRCRESLDLICIDEAEGMHSKDKKGLNDLLNAGYKRGGTVPRTEKYIKKEQKGNTEGYKVRFFPVYGPICLANIWGLDSTLESRCITIVLQRTRSKRVIETPELFEQDRAIFAVRYFFQQCREKGALSGLLESLIGVSVRHLGDAIGGRGIYNNNNIYNIPTPSTSITTTTDINTNFMEGVSGVVSGRDFELFTPLLAVLALVPTPAYIATYTRLKELLIKRAQNRMEEDEDSDQDIRMAESLYQFLQQRGNAKHVLNKEFLDQLADRPEWITTIWLAKFYKRIGILVKRGRDKFSAFYTLDFDKLREYLEVRGLLDDAVSNTQGGGSSTSPPSSAPQKALRSSLEKDDGPKTVDIPLNGTSHATSEIKGIESEMTVPQIAQKVLDILKAGKGVTLGTEEGRWVGLYAYLQGTPAALIDRAMEDMLKSGDIKETRPGVFKIGE